ncbi:hypothetical protein A6R68_04106 [Neotoma lepida]|uniref:PH domain-containing protein n=1 Tax=Neotoma lepida TaxID=56216 RepID=A0A1A6GPR9_NEOLE|nr:hypothetical protein A6R68_04106 [Neotoma lepida]
MISKLVLKQFLTTGCCKDRFALKEKWESGGKNMEGLTDECSNPPVMVHVSMHGQEALFSESMTLSATTTTQENAGKPLPILQDMLPATGQYLEPENNQANSVFEGHQEGLLTPPPSAAHGDMSNSGNDLVCPSWLKKSPPEKKLRLYAWKKRWFLLWSRQRSGNPDVLEYYKNEHSKYALRIINLNFCDTGLTFNKKELQNTFVLDIKTKERTFYLVDETEADMNKWVQSICQICGFTRRESSMPSHSGQSTLFPPVSSHIQPALSTSTKNARGIRQKTDTAVQKLAQGNRHSIIKVSKQVHGFCNLPKPSRHNTGLKDSTYDLPRSLISHSHNQGSLTGSETDNEATYTFQTPNNTLCQEIRELLADNMDIPTIPLSAYQIPRTLKHSAMTPSQAKTPRWGSPQQRPPISKSDQLPIRPIASYQTYEYSTQGGDNVTWSAKFPGKNILGRSDSASSDDS